MYVGGRKRRGAYLLSPRGSMPMNADPMTVSAVFACVNAISEDIAKLPLECYELDYRGRKRKATEDPSYYLLNLEPSESMTRFTFMQVLVSSTILEGNGFAKIVRGLDGVTPTALEYIPSRDVVIYQEVDESGVELNKIAGYQNIRTQEEIAPEDMIHILNFTYNGVQGVSTLTHAANVLNIAMRSDEKAASSFGAGFASSAILKVTRGNLTKQQQDDIRKAWVERQAEESVMVFGGDMEYTPLSLNPRDAQLLESRAFNVPEICRFFRISPVKVGDLSKSSYSTVEAVNLAYLTDTLSPYLEKIEQEFRRKLYPKSKKQRMRVEFDTSSLLRADTAALTGLFSSLFPVGGITPNEIRDKLNLPAIEGGDDVFIGLNTGKLKDFDKNNLDTKNE